jgi:hypothetical protein
VTFLLIVVYRGGTRSDVAIIISVSLPTSERERETERGREEREITSETERDLKRER